MIEDQDIFSAGVDVSGAVRCGQVNVKGNTGRILVGGTDSSATEHKLNTLSVTSSICEGFQDGWKQLIIRMRICGTSNKDHLLDGVNNIISCLSFIFSVRYYVTWQISGWTLDSRTGGTGLTFCYGIRLH